ncbi:hypothetical protein Fmac_007900 [Flemingia macrophylla]|uniref:Uncharacterized protein n=1 Tax=Flemingia macrophylla TaxID=520843 RepID=A0ABD1MVV7_9FABA
MSSTGNNEVGEKSSPHPKKAQKLAAKGKRSRYVIKLPLQIGKSTHTPIVEPRQSQPKNVQPTPSEPEKFDSIPPIPSPHLNASPTPSSTQIHSSRASQNCGPRVSPLSSPSEPNASPHSIPSTRQENVVMQEQTSSEATQPCVPVDPPPGAILPEDFEKIFSQAKSEAASCGGGSESSPLDPGVEEKIRNQSWFFASGGINKGRVYGVGKVEAGYRCGNNFTQPTTSSASSQKITMLEEKVRKTQEENERLSRKFETLLNAQGIHSLAVDDDEEDLVLLEDTHDDERLWEASDIWNAMQRTVQAGDDATNIIFSIMPTLHATQRETLVATIWALWKKHNEKVWNGKDTQPRIAFFLASQMVQEWQHARARHTISLEVLQINNKTGHVLQQAPLNVTLRQQYFKTPQALV